MTSKALRALPDNTYVKVRLSTADDETVRLLRVAEPTQDELWHGHTTNRVHIRRFLLGGWVDTWVYPRDVLHVAEPDHRTLAAIEYVEREVGPKS